MQRIDSSAAHGGTVSGKTLKPASVSAICHSCGQRGVFSIGGYTAPVAYNSVLAEGRCPACRVRTGFCFLNPSDSTSISDVQIYMFPGAVNLFPVPEGVDALPDPLRRALVSTIEAYNARIYSAAAVAGRRTLEGIFKYLLPEEKRNLPLARLIDAAKEEKDLSAPLSALSHAIRTGGNLGAHFDFEREPDESVARQIVELLAYLVSYLYVLPAKIEQLELDLGKADDEGKQE